MTEFRHGNKNPRNLYSGDGAEHHFAVVIGADEHAEYVASWLIDAARAWEATGHPFPPAPDTKLLDDPRAFWEQRRAGDVDQERLHTQNRQSGSELW